MKKTLLICLMGLLCLSLSALTAQVAESPSTGADFLHRSGPHRGGETRSDTFPRAEHSRSMVAEHSRSINTPHEIDGGPWSVSRLPSSSRHVDPGLNKETASLRASARSDESMLLSPVLSTGATGVADIEASVSGLPSQMGFSLVDTTDSAGQGSESSPAQVGEVVTQGIPAVILVEIMSLSPIDSLEFRIWDPYLNELDVPKPFIEKVALSTGTLFDGSRGAKVVQWESPALTAHGRVTLRNGQHTFLDRFLVEPGDSVRILLDFQTAKVLFSGPAAEKFKCQYELANAIENDRYDNDPVMFTWTSDFWGYSPEDSLKIRRIKENQSSIRRSMEYLASDDNGISYLERQFARKPENHPAFEVIARYRGKLQAEFLQVLGADILGNLYHRQVTAFSTLYKGSKEKEIYRRFYRDHLAATMPELPLSSEYSAFYPEFLYQRLVIQSVMEKEPLRNLLAGISQPVRDQVDAIYILKNYRKFKDSNLQFERALGRIETPWISELIGSVYAAQRIGQPVAAIPLTTVDGDSLILAGDSGKIRFLHFWLPGCKASSGAYKRLVAPVEAHFSGDDQVEFVYISHDDNPTRWLSNIQSGDFATAASLNLNAPSSPHPFLKYYNIHNYPTYMVLGKDGTLVSVGNIPRTPETLIQFLDSLKQEVPLIPNPQTK